MTATPRRVLVGVTGASGAMVARSVLANAPADVELHLVCSRWGRHVYRDELGEDPHGWSDRGVRVWNDGDLSSPLASGSNLWEAMIMVPCSASTAAKVACGIGDSLLTRAAQVTLKERRQLLVAWRETPVTARLLEQLAGLARDGATIVPLMPAFYLQPATFEAAADHLAARLWALLGGPPPEGWRAEELAR